MPSGPPRLPVRRFRERRKITGQQALASVQPLSVVSIVSAVADADTFTLHVTLSSACETINLLIMLQDNAGGWHLAAFPSGLQYMADVLFSPGDVTSGKPCYLVGWISGAAISSPVVVTA